MRFRFPTIVALLTLLLTGGAVRADYTYVFTDTTGAVSGNYTVAQGSNISVEVWLYQDGNNGASNNKLITPGLNSGAVYLTANTPPGIVTVNSVTANTTANSGQFDSSAGTSNTSNTVTLTVEQVLNSAVTAPSAGANANRILLGTVSFAGTMAGSTLSVSAVPTPNDPPNYNVAGDNSVLDPLIASSSFTITVTAVPEPGPMILSALGAAGMAFGAWRCRRGRKGNVSV